MQTANHLIRRTILAGGVAVAFGMMPLFALAAPVPISGWAWSGGDADEGPYMGWISMRTQTSPSESTSYGVSIDDVTGALSGYAWSSNLGWVSFNASHVSGCPGGGNCAPRINLTTQKAEGWARACSAFPGSACSGSLDSGSGGWDGWISLGGSNYGITQNPDCTWSGYAWGSDSIGWINFGPITGFGGSDASTRAPAGHAVCQPAVDLYAEYVNEITAVAGVEKNFTSEIVNDGPGTVTLPFYNLLQRADYVDGEGVAVGQITDLNVSATPAPLAAGGRGNVTLPYTFPLADGGTIKYLRICADETMNGPAGGDIPESNASGTGETNNCTEWKPIQVSAGSQPNLTMGRIQISSIRIGWPINFQTPVNNIGSTNVTTSFWNVLQRGSGPLDANGNPTANVTDFPNPPGPRAYISGLNAGASGTVSFATYSFPNSEAGNTVYVRACADKSTGQAAGAITESNEQDNCGEWWPVLITYVDITPNGSLTVVSPSAPTVGSPVSFTSAMFNAGTHQATNFYNVFQITSPSGESTRVSAGQVTTQVNPQNSFSMSYANYTPTETGTYSVRACGNMNTSGTVGTSLNELNTGNNCGAWKDFTVGTPVQPDGNLTLSPTSCVIAEGDSTCHGVFATWNTSNVSSPSVVDANTDTTLSTLANQSEPGMEVWVAYPQTTFELRNGASVLDTEVATASCAEGTGWDTDSNTCTQEACTANCGNGGDDPDPVVNGSCAATHYVCVSGTPANQTDGVSLYTWDCLGSGGGSDDACSESKGNEGDIAPSVEISANPTRVKVKKNPVTGATQYGSTDITWSITGGSAASSCMLSSDNGYLTEYSTNPPTGPTVETDSTIEFQTIYTINCTNNAGTGTASVTVNVTVSFEEF